MIILKGILKKYGEWMCTGFMWVMMDTSGGLLWRR